VKPVLELSQGLSAPTLDAIAALERRTVAADGGRLKLEWGTLSRRSSDETNDVLWWDRPQLLGFLGLYSFDGRNVELVGMVDPAARRAGIASALLNAAMSVCRDRTYESILLVTPRNSDAGRLLALGRGGVLDHSEHALVLTHAPNAKPSAIELDLRHAVVDDAPIVTRLLADAFGSAPDDIGERIAKDPSPTYLLRLQGPPLEPCE
jgi:GNAT superfamily N-acetyltransferase